jgi:hypothetical protein
VQNSSKTGRVEGKTSTRRTEELHMARRRGPTLDEAIRHAEEVMQREAADLEAASQGGHDGTTSGDPEARVLSPQELIDRLQSIYDAARTMGETPMFATDQELESFAKNIGQALYVKYVAILNRALEILTKRLEEDDGTLKDIASAVNTLGNQLQNLRGKGTAGVNVPKSEAELDQKLKELEARQSSRLRVVK